jgi:hypothetical protein
MDAEGRTVLRTRIGELDASPASTTSPGTEVFLSRGRGSGERGQGLRGRGQGSEGTVKGIGGGLKRFGVNLGRMSKRAAQSVTTDRKEADEERSRPRRSGTPREAPPLSVLGG